MLDVAVTVLLIVWLLGILSAYTLGGAIHLCLFLAMLILAFRVVKGRPGGPDRHVW